MYSLITNYLYGKIIKFLKITRNRSDKTKKQKLFSCKLSPCKFEYAPFIVINPPVPGFVHRYLLQKSSDVSSVGPIDPISTPNAMPVPLQVDA